MLLKGEAVPAHTMKAYTRSTGTIPLTVNADTKVKIL
jgi:hypothetical protein